ncbi:MAG: aconitase/3-isopropylmalate dehydratase large subunit family protein [Candidatus Aenigmatarchaeota archaeon]
MGTVIEKIIKKKGRVEGDIAILPVDMIMSHDQTTPLAIESFEEFEKEGAKPKKEKMIIVFDHICPPSFPEASYNQKIIKEFCKKYGINFYEGQGICHALMLEEGFVRPWDVIVGGDSHTPCYGVAGALGLGMGSTDIAACWKTGETWIQIPESIHIKIEGEPRKGIYPKDVSLKYVGELGADGALDKAIEFSGSFLKKLTPYERMPIGLMATEVGAITEIFYLEEYGLFPENPIYAKELEIEVEKLEPLIACPHKPHNIKAVREVAGKEVDQIFIGSCTNGTIYDLREVAKILKGRKVNPYTRTLIIPATLKTYEEAYKEGLIDIFVRAGAMVVLPPSCGPCLGRQAGVLGKNQVCVSTSNRNYEGRMGDPTAEIYLASPATAAATAIEGRIADPRGYLNG